MTKNLELLFYPKSLALVGASGNPQKIGYLIAKNILTSGYQGESFLINPKLKELLENTVYPDLQVLPKTPEVLILAIPVAGILAQIQTLASLKNQLKESFQTFAIIISAGFGETGSEGKILENQILEVAKKANISIVGPNCLGIINNDSSSKYKYNGSFGFTPDISGNISLVSQSGAIISGLVDKACEQGFGFNKIISVGNKIDIEISDYINYLENDPKTDVIAIYSEGYKNGQDLTETIRNTKKPVIMLKSGQSEKAKQAIGSHTGSIAGDGEVAKMYLQKVNSIQVQNLEEFFNCLVLFQKYKSIPTKILS
jgi:acyl-CoA synthetase (NDP forming)